MVKKGRKAARKSSRTTRKPSKPRIKRSKVKRVRRSSKATQVTGAEIDEACENLANRTVLERKILEKAENDEDSYPNILISANYKSTSPFDPDEDVDDEPENRKNIYEVQPKPRSPIPGTSSGDENQTHQQEPPKNDWELQWKSKNGPYNCYFG